jgi:hypothetical protein
MKILAVGPEYGRESEYVDRGEILNPKDSRTESEIRVLLHKKMNADEKIVRRELVKVWTQVLQKYAQPGVHIPSVEDIRGELLNVGVDAAVRAVVDEHWFVFSWMIEEGIREKIGRGLQKFDLAGFVSDTKAAQSDPGILRQLGEKIKQYVLFEEF